MGLMNMASTPQRIGKIAPGAKRKPLARGIEDMFDGGKVRGRGGIDANVRALTKNEYVLPDDTAAALGGAPVLDAVVDATHVPVGGKPPTHMFNGGTAVPELAPGQTGIIAVRPTPQPLMERASISGSALPPLDLSSSKPAATPAATPTATPTAAAAPAPAPAAAAPAMPPKPSALISASTWGKEYQPGGSLGAKLPVPGTAPTSTLPSPAAPPPITTPAAPIAKSAPAAVPAMTSATSITDTPSPATGQPSYTRSATPAPTRAYAGWDSMVQKQPTNPATGYPAAFPRMANGGLVDRMKLRYGMKDGGLVGDAADQVSRTPRARRMEAAKRVGVEWSDSDDSGASWGGTRIGNANDLEDTDIRKVQKLLKRPPLVADKWGDVQMANGGLVDRLKARGLGMKDGGDVDPYTKGETLRKTYGALLGLTPRPALAGTVAGGAYDVVEKSPVGGFVRGVVGAERPPQRVVPPSPQTARGKITTAPAASSPLPDVPGLVDERRDDSLLARTQAAAAAPDVVPAAAGAAPVAAPDRIVQTAPNVSDAGRVGMSTEEANQYYGAINAQQRAARGAEINREAEQARLDAAAPGYRETEMAKSEARVADAHQRWALRDILQGIGPKGRAPLAALALLRDQADRARARAEGMQGAVPRIAPAVNFNAQAAAQQAAGGEALRQIGTQRQLAQAQRMDPLAMAAAQEQLGQTRVMNPLVAAAAKEQLMQAQRMNPLAFEAAQEQNAQTRDTNPLLRRAAEQQLETGALTLEEKRQVQQYQRDMNDQQLTPERRKEARQNMLAVLGKTGHDIGRIRTQKVYNDMGQVIAEEKFDSTTGEPIQEPKTRPSREQAVAAAKAAAAKDPSKRAEINARLESWGYEGI